MSTDPANPFHSKNLIYRAPEPTDDEPFFAQILQTDPIGYRNANVDLFKPVSKNAGKDYLKYVTEETLISVVICLPPSSAEAESAGSEVAAKTNGAEAKGEDAKAAEPKPIPIGVIHLEKLRPVAAHHRHATIGVELLKAYQGKGYGSEAIRWILRWAFRTAGLHRVGIGAFEWNTGAIRLYERIGFKHERRERERWWCEGRFWDDIGFGMLDRDWEELERNGKA